MQGIVCNIKYFHNWYIAGYFKFLCNFVIENDYEEAISKDIKAYSRLLKSASEFETKHFPQIIPPESKNIKAYKSPDSFFLEAKELFYPLKLIKNI